jgi:hypothetical protein
LLAPIDQKPAAGGRILTLSRRQLEKKISEIMRKWRFRNFLPSYDTSPKTH